MKCIVGISFLVSIIVVNLMIVILVWGILLFNVDKVDGWVVGFNLGIVYEMDENNCFGLFYCYSLEFKVKDDYG